MPRQGSLLPPCHLWREDSQLNDGAHVQAAHPVQQAEVAGRRFCPGVWAPLRSVSPLPRAPALGLVRPHECLGADETAVPGAGALPAAPNPHPGSAALWSSDPGSLSSALWARGLGPSQLPLNLQRLMERPRLRTRPPARRSSAGTRAATGAALMLHGGGCRGRQSSPGSTPARPRRPTSQPRRDRRAQGGFGWPQGCAVTDGKGWWGGLGGAGAFALCLGCWKAAPTPADSGGASWDEQGFLRQGWTPLTTRGGWPCGAGPP